METKPSLPINQISILYLLGRSGTIRNEDILLDIRDT